MKKDLIILFFPKATIDIRVRRIPNALLFLKRMLFDIDVDVILIDQNLEDNYEKIIIENSDRLLLAGISSMTGHQIIEGIEFSQKVRSNSNAKILWGGWHPTLLPEQVLEQDYVDFIIEGQGELPFRHLVESLVNGYDFYDIQGLGYKKNNKLVINQNNTFQDPNTFPPIDYKSFDITPYIYRSKFAERTFEFYISYGCPYNCAFCSLATVYNRKWYHADTASIISNLKYFNEVYGIDCIKFNDDNFFVNKNFTIELCKAIIDSGLKIKWLTSAHAGHFIRLFDDSDVKLMKAAGLITILVGAETGDQEVLGIICKKTTPTDNLDMLRLMKKNNINTHFSIILCFPYNPDKDVIETFKMLVKAKLIDTELILQFHFFIPFPGTAIYVDSLNYGFIPPDSMESWARLLETGHDTIWKKPKHIKTLRIFSNFYFVLINPLIYKKAKGLSKLLVLICTIVFYPIVYFRYRTNFFKFPFEAIAFLGFVKMINRAFGTKFKLRPEEDEY